MTQTKPAPAKSSSPFVFYIERTFNAPRDRVWRAWTDPEHVKQWFGPKGCTMLFNKIDLRPGGASSYGMDFSGNRMYGQWAYQEVAAPEKLVAIVSFLDEKGNKIHHPMSPDWPIDILSVVKFIDLGDKTKITVEWTAHNASDAERKTFEEGASGMNQGWTGSFDQLEEFLGKTK